MAERVHLHLEFGLGELEEMERIGLFNRGEIRKIVKKRKNFEYKLQRRMKKKEDFLNYINFESCLLLLINKRRKRLLCDSKKEEINKSISKRIIKLFRSAISRFPDDEELWQAQISYLKKMKLYDSLSSLYAKLLQMHSKSPKLWVEAAKWEAESHNSYDNARKIFQKGVLMNPKSELLWREYFRIELKYIEVIRKRREILRIENIQEDNPEDDVVLKGTIVDIVYDKAIEEIPDVEFALSFIQICLEFDFAAKHFDHILNDVSERFPEKEETLDALAKRPLLDVQKRIERAKRRGIKKKVVLKTMYEEIYNKYDEAVKLVPTEKMWNCYLDFLFSVLHSAKDNKKVKLQSSVINKMEQAAEANCLSLDYYTKWIELLFNRGNKEEALAISLSAARKWNKVSLWLKSLTLHIKCLESNKKIYCLFSEALSSLKERETISIWKLGVEWLSVSDTEKLIEFFEKGIHKCKEISAPLKEMYLEATALRSGIQASRNLYKKFKKMGSLSLNLVRKMVAIEKGQVKPSLELIRKCFEDGVKEFGADSIEIWLEYMQFEVKHTTGNPMLYGMLYWRALKTLRPELTKEFQSRVTEYCTGCGLTTNWELIS